MPSNYTTNPPEEEGLYWIALEGEVKEYPARLAYAGSDIGWFCHCPGLPSFTWGHQKETVHRSIHPVTPPLFDEESDADSP